MSPATLTPARPAGRTAEHERPAGPPLAGVAPGEPTHLTRAADAVTFDGELVDPLAVEAARDAVARYLGELGLAVNSRPAAAAIAACLDGALHDAGPQADAAALRHAAVRHAVLGVPRWLAALGDRGPVPPRHALVAARLGAGRTPAVPAHQRRAMTPQRFGR